MSQLIDLDQRYVWHPFTQAKTAGLPIPIVSAEGALLQAEDGKTYIDANSSWWVNTHGHGEEHISQAIKDQLDQLGHVIFAGVTHPKAVELASRISALLPGTLNRSFFSDDGSTAVEVALKMSLQYWFNQDQKKHRILAMDGAYHGDTFGAMSVGQRSYFNKPFEHLFFQVDYMGFPSKENEAPCLTEAEAYFKSGEFAALIVEPIVQGSAGMRMYRPQFLDQLMILARKYDVLIIFDEIMTGWGRTGRLFAMNYLQDHPDIVCLSKGLTGGVLPLGLTVASDFIYDAFWSDEKEKALLHGHSFTGNALACAAACANLDLIEDPAFFEEIERIATAHYAFVQHLKEHEAIAHIRQTGTILAIEVRQQEESSYFSGIRDVIYEHFLNDGILLRPLGNVLFVNPPYCIKDEELAQIYASTKRLLDRLLTDDRLQ
ncbi:MAG: adenosylmethionine--8-amino-7-oxononanoate transaminase [Bacteroidetes bacterium]|nr:MAG: adenosylmethionine--8-amino-7-oxononanoate transaminase [Bacteroidota bacterium]